MARESTLLSHQVAAAAGVNVETLRYYERRGILRRPQRSRAGYRQYGADTVELLRFVKRAQGLGFTLDEIQELLALRRPRAGRCASVHAAAISKIEQIDAKIQSLSAMRGALDRLAAGCACDSERLQCPIIEALADGARKDLP